MSQVVLETNLVLGIIGFAKSVVKRELIFSQHHETNIMSCVINFMKKKKIKEISIKMIIDAVNILKKHNVPIEEYMARLLGDNKHKPNV